MKTTVETPTTEHDIRTLVGRISALETKTLDLEGIIAKQEALIKWYERQMLINRRRRFGSSSEFCNPGVEQLTLLGEIAIAPPPAEVEEVTVKRKKRKGKREEDLATLPVIRVEHELAGNDRVCPDCGTGMDDIGSTVARREIEIIPAQAVLKEHAVHSYVCPKKCLNEKGNTGIVTASAPKPLIPGSLASPSLVAHIAGQKYMMGMPLYRLEKGFWHDGVNISRQNMSNWVVKCYQLYLISIYVLLKTFLLKESYLHADETTIQTLREPGRPAQSKSYEWVYRTGAGAKRGIVIYEYRETRKREHPQNFLRGFKGFLNTDGYQAYHGLGADITVVGCWAHARRYWEKIWKIIPEEQRKGSDAEKGLLYINALFKMEREYAKQKLSAEQRYEKRLEKSRPVADDFFSWIDSLTVLPKGLLGEAVTYARNQRVYLNNVFADGNLEISNNRCERAVKPFVQGRKAWLFSNTPEGAEASSAMFSIIETAKENGLVPYQYVKFLLETVPHMSSSDNLEKLLPWSDSLPDWCRTPKGSPKVLSAVDESVLSGM